MFHKFFINLFKFYIRALVLYNKFVKFKTMIGVVNKIDKEVTTAYLSHRIKSGRKSYEEE